MPGFKITPENRHLVSALCRRLDGIPLALELAAVRLRVISLAQVVDRVDDALRLLNVGDRAGAPADPAVRRRLEPRAVLGGRTAAVATTFGPPTAITQRLDMITGTWQRRPDLNLARSGSGLVATDPALYTIGGFLQFVGGNPDATDEVERLPLAPGPTAPGNRPPRCPTHLRFTPPSAPAAPNP